MSANGSTSAVRLRERRNRRRLKAGPFKRASLESLGTGRRRPIELRRHVAVDVPRHAFVGDFGVFAQVFQRIGWRSGINAFHGVLSGFLLSLLLHTLSAVKN